MTHAKPEQASDEVGGYPLAERITGIGRPTLYSLVFAKRIPHVRLGRRFVRFCKADLEKWLTDRKVAAQ